ncbi:MAG: hypothetical protein ABIH23_08865 [bacterium]
MKKKTIVYLALLCLVTGVAESSRVLPMSLPQIVDDAGKIFVGKCTEVKSGQDPESGFIVTWITFEVSQRVKGDVGETETIKQIGGTHEGITVTSFTPKFRVGEEVLLFVYPESSVGLTSAVGLDQGKFSIYKDQDTGKQKVTNRMPENVLFAAELTKMSKKRGYQIKGVEDPIVKKAKSMDLEPFVESVKSMIKETR